MTFIQRLFKTLLPATWAADMEAESRRWQVRCPCGFAQSIWDWGGIRWHARGSPRRLLHCPHCGQVTWHTVTRSHPET